MDKQTILVVEDNTTLRRYIGNNLERAGFRVLLADSGEAAYSYLQNEILDLVLLDLKLGDVDGMEILKTIRRYTESLPVIIVSSSLDLVVKLDGFEIGCDDYITKPFYSEELISRIQRQLRRTPHYDNERPQQIARYLQVGPYKLDIQAAKVFKNNEPIEMRKKLFDIMLFFVQHPDEILSKQRILAHCWDDASEFSDNTLYVHIRQLRSLIEDDPQSPEHIITVRGVGFVFRPHCKARHVSR